MDSQEASLRRWITVLVLVYLAWAPTPGAAADVAPVDRIGVPDWTAVEALIREWQPDLLVVGEPLNMDGSPSELGARAQKFARRLHGRLGLPVELADERLSSFEAKQESRARGHGGDFRKEPVDSYAAELILQTWLRASAP